MERVFFFFFFFFFFQAEDGIRDGHVTGVQTCALPICNAVARDRLLLFGGHRSRSDVDDDRAFYGQWNNPEQPRSSQPPKPTKPKDHATLILLRNPEPGNQEIGRASCRERVKIMEDAGA